MARTAHPGRPVETAGSLDRLMCLGYHRGQAMWLASLKDWSCPMLSLSLSLSPELV